MSDGMSDARDYGPTLSKHGPPMFSVRGQPSLREACRQRLPLGGVDAEALEHGLTQLETMLREAREALRTIAKACEGAESAALMGIGSVAKRGLKKSSEYGFQD